MRLEAEHKYMLTVHEYLCLMEALEKTACWFNRKMHINYYFDTEDFKLHKSNESLRIRNSNNVYTITYKDAPIGKAISNYWESNEYEAQIYSNTP